MIGFIFGKYRFSIMITTLLIIAGAVDFIFKHYGYSSLGKIAQTVIILLFLVGLIAYSYRKNKKNG